MNDYRVIIADDHQLLRQGIRHIIETTPGLRVVGEAGDGMELLKMLRRTPADMVLLDISMPKLRGLEAIHEIKSQAPSVKILILTMHKRIEFLHDGLKAGAEGYLLKDDTDQALIEAITAIRNGQTYLSPTLSDTVTKNLITQWRTGVPEEEDPLSTREKEVLKLIAEGKSNKQIADILGISVKTVEHHRASLMKKLGFKNVAEVILYAVRKGFIVSD
jgi:DNA-binding NarL/FixJ family response regulator